MHCSNCGATNPEGSEFCASCGAKLGPSGSPSPQGGPPPIPPRLRPMGIGDIIDETVRLYRQNFRLFILVVAVLEVPIFVLQMIQSIILTPQALTTGLIDVETGEIASAGPLIFSMLSTFVLSIIAFLAYAVIEAALTSAIADRYLDRPVTLGTAYRAIGPRSLRVLGATIIVGLVAAGLVLIGFAVFVGGALFTALAAAGSSEPSTVPVVATCLGMPLMFIGLVVAVWLGVRWSLFIQAIVVEDKGVVGSLARSWGLVKGKWWKSCGTLFVASIVTAVVSGVGSVISVVIMGVGGFVLTSSFNAFTVAGSVVSLVFTLLMLPVIPIASTLLYFDLRNRKEGLDLQMMNDRLGRA